MWIHLNLPFVKRFKIPEARRKNRRVFWIPPPKKNQFSKKNKHFILKLKDMYVPEPPFKTLKNPTVPAVVHDDLFEDSASGQFSRWIFRKQRRIPDQMMETFMCVCVEREDKKERWRERATNHFPALLPPLSAHWLDTWLVRPRGCWAEWAGLRDAAMLSQSVAGYTHTHTLLTSNNKNTQG